jgi:putative ABC transport system ATP-binding protein
MPDSKANILNTSTMIRVDHLSKRVQTADGELVIVNDAHFSVDAGEAVAVVGASGSGKG